MEEMILLFEEHGYLLLFAIGFLEFIGAPVAGVPVLMVAGGVAAARGLSFPGIVLAAVLGGLVADGIWYWIARLRGRGMVDMVCGLSSNPMACVLSVEGRVAAVGPWLLLPAKFIPGTGNLVAAAAGFAGIPFGVFVMFDAFGLLAWATAYTGIGWVFSAQVELILSWGGRFASWILGGAALLVVAAGAWRVAKARMHRVMHQREKEPEALALPEGLATE